MTSIACRARSSRRLSIAPGFGSAWFGIAGSPSSLWVAESDAAGSLELCLGAEHPQAVDAFHVEAVGAGGRSRWEPGIRPEFSRDYYAARIEDPDGNAIELFEPAR